MKDKLITKSTAKFASEKGLMQKNKKNIIEKHNFLECNYFYDPTHSTETAIDCHDLKFYSSLAESRMYYVPTQSLLKKWLRDIHNIHVSVDKNEDNWKYEIYTFFNGNKHISSRFKNYKSYEEALEVGLAEALKLI